MPPRKAMAFIVRLVPPSGAEAADLRAYVEDAVATWKGSYNPENPIFDLDPDTVRASYHQARTIARDLSMKGMKNEIARLTVENDQIRRKLLDCQSGEGIGRPATKEEERRFRS